MEQWLIQDRCRLIGILGMGGIGKSALVAQLAEQTQNHFDYFIWSSLRESPSLNQLLATWIPFLSDQKLHYLPSELDQQLTILLDYLRHQRCLLVLDNLETILQVGGSAGQYRSGYEAYGQLLRVIGEGRHQSCLLLTSREKPTEFAPLEGVRDPVRTLLLTGLNQKAGQTLLKAKDLFDSNQSMTKLIERYSGNPLALTLMAETVRELFFGDIAQFLREDITIFGGISDLLAKQFARLSRLGQELLVWLAIEREPIGLEQLQVDLTEPVYFPFPSIWRTNR